MVFDFLNPIFNPIFDPILSFSPFWIIFLIALFVTLFTSLVYKFATDQDLMKRLKQEQKDMQKKLKDLREHPEKLKSHQKDMMQKNMEYMKHSMKPMLYTFIPIIILFGWLGSHLAFAPILPGEVFSVNVTLNEEIDILDLKTDLEIVSYDPNGKSHTWELKGNLGEYLLEFKINENFYDHLVIISNEQRYVEPLKKFETGKISSISVSNYELKPLGSTSIFGWKPGWLGMYIILSIVLSIIIRKSLKIN